MKLIIICLSFFAFQSICQSVHAYEGFRCVPSMRDTRFQVLVTEKTVELLVTSPMGYNFMPQFESPQSVFHQGFNKMQGEDLKALGDQFQFIWKKEGCQVDSKQFKISCLEPAALPVKDIKAYGLTTTEVVEKYGEDTYEKRKFRLSLEKGNMYFVSQQFEIRNCEVFH